MPGCISSPASLSGGGSGAAHPALGGWQFGHEKRPTCPRLCPEPAKSAPTRCNRPLCQYYYNSNQPDLTPALGWLDEYIKANPAEAYYGYYWKAKLLQKQGKNPAAGAAARKSLDALSSDKNEVSREEYTRLNMQLIAEVTKK